MSIQYNGTNRIFVLSTNHSTYQIGIDPYGFLLHLYYGARTEQLATGILAFADRGFSGNPYDAGEDRTYSMDVLPQELPYKGNGDYRNTALVIEDYTGTIGCDFRYVSHNIYKGKYKLSGLPAAYADSNQAETLEIRVKDAVLNVEVILLYGVFPELDVITRSAIVKNQGEHEIYIQKAAACLDFINGDYDLISFHGRHAMERNMERTKVGHHAIQIGSRRGTSSHQYNPFMILADETTTEQYGNCYGMSFVYSGGFEGVVEKDQMNQTRMILGLQSEQLRYRLEAQKEFVIPEVLLSYSNQGLSQLSYNYHRIIRQHICRGKYQLTSRPVLVNSWEASYFDINADNLIHLAKEAADLGIEMLVMDDGWFGKRDDDNSGLGDWIVNEKKLGMPLSQMIEKINDMGIKFGIWFEPEMVNEDSDLYRKHPDYALVIPGRKPVRGRNQLVLDFSRPEVVDYVYNQMAYILDNNHIEYIKWDMNRSIHEVYSHTAKNQGNVLYDYMLGLYDFLERINQNYPDILLEGCSGGGGRFDAGMLYYTPQIWCSDNTDAIDRLRIQYGTSFGYPVSAVGSHVSAVPNHQTGRKTPLSTRGVVAMSGTFGYELDLQKLSADEKEIIREQVKTYKEYAKLIADGRYYRLSDPSHSEVAAWEHISEDGAEVLLQAVLQEIHGNMTPVYIRPVGLQSGAVYEDVKTGREYSADILMSVGMLLDTKLDEYQSYQIKLNRKD